MQDSSPLDSTATYMFAQITWTNPLCYSSTIMID
jgi:hypothetical protein